MNCLRVTHRMFPLKPYFCTSTSRYFAFPNISARNFATISQQRFSEKTVGFPINEHTKQAL
jgi:hypothetical protein